MKQALIGAAITAIICLILWFLFSETKNGDSESNLATIAKLRVEIRSHADHDSLWAHQVSRLQDSVNLKEKAVSYWRTRYSKPIIVTRTMIKTVFAQDSATIAAEVSRGTICDSLQEAQNGLIVGLKKEVAGLDTLNRIRGVQINSFVRLDSVNQVQIKGLKKEVKTVKRKALVVAGVAVVVAILSFLKGS